MITIVVPIYNAENYLRRCLDSIMRQTYQDFEVLLIDDGSTDTSKSICEIYVDADSRCKYIYQDNAGPDAARKTGTVAARGQYITYVDADDYIHENTLEVMLSNAVETDVDIVCAQITRFNNRREWPGSKYFAYKKLIDNKADILKAFFEDEILIGTYYAKLIRYSVMENYEFIENGLIGEDITAALFMFDKANSILVIPDRLYYYFQNSNSISHSKFNYRHAISLENYIRVRDSFLDNPYVSSNRICGYFAGYQMAVATAMGRNRVYEKRAGNILRNDLKSHWVLIKKDTKTAFYMKLCILLYISMPKVFVRLFGILNKLTGR